MTVKKKTLLGSSESSSKWHSKKFKPEPAPQAASPSGLVSMRRVVAKKLAVEKLVAAKRLG